MFGNRNKSSTRQWLTHLLCVLAPGVIGSFALLPVWCLYHRFVLPFPSFSAPRLSYWKVCFPHPVFHGLIFAGHDLVLLFPALMYCSTLPFIPVFFEYWHLQASPRLVFHSLVSLTRTSYCLILSLHCALLFGFGLSLPTDRFGLHD
jgi:hypothetical protein